MTSNASSPLPKAQAGNARRSGPILVLCACEEPMQAVLCETTPPSILANRAETAGRRAMTLLAPAVAEILAERGITARELGGVACVRGPGSFSGIRIVLSLAAGLLAGARTPLAGLDYLPLLAAEAASRRTENSGRVAPPANIAVVSHARRDVVYLQIFDDHHTGAAPAPRGELRVCSPAEAARVIAESTAQSGPAIAVGGALALYPQAFAPLGGMIELLPEVTSPSPRTLAAAAIVANYAETPIEPLYARLSDAEENLESIAAARGLSLDEAQRMLSEAAPQA